MKEGDIQMGKTDKELAADVVVAFLESRNGPGKFAISSSQLPDLIASVFHAFHELPTELDNESGADLRHV